MACGSVRQRTPRARSEMKEKTMHRRFIPAHCAHCGAAVPRAAAGRCPSCRTDFAAANAPHRPEPRRLAPDRPALREKDRIATPRDPRRLP